MSTVATHFPRIVFNTSIEFVSASTVTNEKTSGDFVLGFSGNLVPSPMLFERIKAERGLERESVCVFYLCYLVLIYKAVKYQRVIHLLEPQWEMDSINYSNLG